MISYHLTSSILGIFLAITILWLIRRDHLHSRHAVWWLIVVMAVTFLGFFPNLINPIAQIFGVSYPPSLLFLFSISLILVKLLLIDIHHSNLERKCRRLTQKLAILETQLEQLSSASSKSDQHFNEHEQ
ncbi:DUF2304 domain-containing protein [Thioflexithrix psekupsensis]|uniref:DUF2304 domain-containing protein n=1 Tax=Thioflexithrix psekupsensis TaxID=1570016 RepID=A0A251XCC7_9GAMM|nr:DUF2304 domain-containing protein [Thioflexithrix psekupsensis]OUD16248.1 hypothetical protein TPSD3_00555 [Thioflexithrix psekupsensis]